MEIKISSNSVFPIKNYSNLKANSGRIRSPNIYQTIKKNKNVDNNISLNSTGFTYKNFKKNDSANIKKDLENENENGNDEKIIKDTIFKLSIWDNEILEKSKFKGLKIIDSYNKETKRQTELIKKKEEVDNLIKKQLSSKELLPKIKSERMLKQNKSQIYSFKEKIINFNALIKEANENKLINDQDNLEDISKQYYKEQKKTEFKHRKDLMDIYEKILLNKLKKKKYENILNDTYQLLENARTEYNLCIDIIKERIKSVEKYYYAFIQNNNSNSNRQINSHTNINNDNIQSNHNSNISNNNIHSSNENNITNKENNIKMNNTVQSDENNVSNIIDDNNSNNTQNSGESKKKMKRKKNSEIMEEKIRKYNEFFSIKNDLLLELKGYEDRFSLINEQLSKIIKKSKEKIKKCDDNRKYYNYLFVEFSNEQKKYYLDILKKGTDTRNQGLTWVVKRLIELKVNIDTNMFPPFLDNEQIEYIINISKLGFERSQLKLLFNALKHRSKLTKSQSFNNINKVPEKRIGGSIKTFIKEKFKPEVFINKFNEQMENLYLKHEDYSKIILEKKLEEKDINNIVIKNKTKLHQYAINKNIFDEKKEDNVFHIFMEHQKQQRHFDDIIQINNRIKEITTFINKLIKEETIIFENKIKFLKLRKEESMNDFKDKVSKALFGSYTDL